VLIAGVTLAPLLQQSGRTAGAAGIPAFARLDALRDILG
jgi:hypothetical protein